MEGAMKLLASLVFVAAAVAGGDAGAAELKMFTSRALATVLAVIGQQFEQSSGHKLNVIAASVRNSRRASTGARHSTC
jgi:hypothetical protein